MAAQVSDNAYLGQNLTVTPADWSGTPTVTDEWFRCDSSGSNCADTGVSGSTYTIGSADVNKRLEVEETASDGTNTTTAWSNQTPVITSTSSGQDALSPPTLSPTATAHQATQITATDATWVTTPDSVSDQWLRCNANGSDCAAISGATGSTYTPGRDDAGYAIELQQTAVVGGVEQEPVTSAPTVAVVPDAPTPTNGGNPPSISAGNHVGDTLTASHGDWDNQPTSYAYQWLRCDSSGANCTTPLSTSTTYTLTSDDVGHRIIVQVTASVDGVSSAPENSNPTPVIVPPAPANTSAPAIGGGTATQGQTLTASTGSWTESPTGYGYQWYDCAGGSCSAISGATGQSYTLGAGDVGKQVLVQVTASNDGGTSAPASSPPTATVQTPSTTSLSFTPAAPVTNQMVTLAATVTTNASQISPAGTVTFTAGGQPIGGCQNVGVPASGSSATVLCQTSFAAGQQTVTATYSPSGSVPVLGSASDGRTITISPDATMTTLDVSAKVMRGQKTTFTATVAPATSRTGTIAPGGYVQFRDGNAPIATCAHQPINGGAATCTISYPKPTIRVIWAKYLGDDNFNASTSATKRLDVTGPTTLGSLTATMQWTFHYTPSYTRVVAMTVNGMPQGSTVRAQCHGRACPFTSRRRAVTRQCTVKKGKKRCAVPAHVALASWFRARHLGVGATVTVLLTRPRYQGKYYRFTMRARRQPKVQIACLAVNSTTPGKRC